MKPEQARGFMQQVRDEAGVPRERMQHGTKRDQRYVRIERNKFHHESQDEVIGPAASDWGSTASSATTQSSSPTGAAGSSTGSSEPPGRL